MNAFTTYFYTISRKKNRLFKTALALVLLAVLLVFPSCTKKIDYLDYVSELRSNIFLAQTEDFLLRAYAVEKETPYSSDGVKRETSTRTEIYLTAPSGDKSYDLAFTVDGETYGGELSYDNVKGEYYYSCTLDIRGQTELICTLTCEGEETQLTARSVVTETTLAPETALETLIAGETELFEDMTDEYGFAGEIYLRLIYEDNPYYYIGVIDREGGTTAFLMNATTGKVLAKRESAA